MESKEAVAEQRRLGVRACDGDRHGRTVADAEQESSASRRS